MTKFCMLDIHKRLLENVCSTDSIVLSILAVKFPLVTEIMTKHSMDTFLLGHAVYNGSVAVSIRPTYSFQSTTDLAQYIW